MMKENFLSFLSESMNICCIIFKYDINSRFSQMPLIRLTKFLFLSNWSMIIIFNISSVQFSHSVMSDSLQPHELQHVRPPCPSPTPEFTQTHVHWVGDTIQPSHPLSSPFPPAPNPSQHQSLFQWVNSSHEVAKVLEFQPQHQSFQRNPRADLL